MTLGMCEQRKRLKPPLVRWAGSGQGPGGFTVQAQATGRFYTEELPGLRMCDRDLSSWPCGSRLLGGRGDTCCLYGGQRWEGGQLGDV